MLPQQAAAAPATSRSRFSRDRGFGAVVDGPYLAARAETWCAGSHQPRREPDVLVPEPTHLRASSLLRVKTVLQNLGGLP